MLLVLACIHYTASCFVTLPYIKKPLFHSHKNPFGHLRTFCFSNNNNQLFFFFFLMRTKEMQLTSLQDYLHDISIRTPAYPSIYGYWITPDSNAQIARNKFTWIIFNLLAFNPVSIWGDGILQHPWSRTTAIHYSFLRARKKITFKAHLQGAPKQLLNKFK